ncbi:MAG: Rieske 2Fe-2S domain-containing protein [bacterium]|nr:Rieske 2Fe-2S domain-containing protein [bacterium]
MAARKSKAIAAPIPGEQARINGHSGAQVRVRAQTKARGKSKAGSIKSAPSLTDFTHPVCSAKRIKTEKPFRFHLAGIAYVLWRDRSGAYHCVEDECPHRRASLACGHVVQDAIYCPYHNWRVRGDGQCASPSDPEVSFAVPRFRVFEHLGYLWMRRDEAPEPARETLMPAQPGWKFAGTAHVTMNAPLEIVMDNFSENEHVPWIHAGLGWDEARVASVDFEFEKTDWGSRVVYRAQQRPNLLFRLLLVGTDDTYINEFHSEFEPLRTTYYISWEKKDGRGKRPLATASTVYFVPETDGRTTLHFFFQYRLSALRFLEPIVKRSIPFLAWKEAIDDKRFLESAMQDASADLKGMKLRKFDRPIALHRKLLHERYLRGTKIGAGSAPH